MACGVQLTSSCGIWDIEVHLSSGVWSASNKLRHAVLRLRCTLRYVHQVARFPALLYLPAKASPSGPYIEVAEHLVSAS